MAKKQNPQILSPENYIRQRARNMPIFKCYVNDGWDEGGLAQVTVSRCHVNGNITFCSYLVDLHCLGIKDTLFDFNIPKGLFDEFIEEMSQEFELIECDYVLAHNIIYAGWEFAAEIGFKPHKDFLSTTQYMLEEDNDTIPLLQINCGDTDGKPLYIHGPFEDEAMANRIINTLEKNVGAGNYHYIVLGEDLLFDDWDEEADEEDDDYDDDEYEGDVPSEDWEEDAENPPLGDENR
ncbi:MAG TPA: hypothetical protein DEQ06_04785 [Porphyromonadaceae bacterium]|nr:hypothetical protein [Porphyromonadaceae bacterium]